MLYLDTSAFLKLYFLEAGSREVESRVTAQDQALPVWDLLEAEFTNALHLKVFWQEATADEARAQMERFYARKRKGFYHTPYLDRVGLMSEFALLREHTPRLGCRTMDILHVACARLLEVSEFLTFDVRQRELARQSGLHAPLMSA